MNTLQVVRNPIAIGFMIAVVSISPAAIELCSFESPVPHTHIEVYTAAASTNNLTYTISATTTATTAVNAVFYVA